MNTQNIKSLLRGEKVEYKSGAIFIDRGADYGEKFEYGFMAWKHTDHGNFPLSIHEHLEDAMKEIDGN